MPGQLQKREHPACGPLGVLEDENVRLVLVVGKGGVGKTTTAAALAFHLAQKFPARRHLAVSAGPSHSLSGVLKCPLDSCPRPVPGTGNLRALEMDAVQLFSQFRTRHGQALRMTLGRGTYLDEEDISRFLELSFPGLDELMAMIELINLLESGEHDSIIVDTAPTGHTLRLLSLPALTSAWISMLNRMLEKHRFMSRLYTHRYRKDEADEFIDKLNHDLSRLASVLRDRRQCRFLVVTLLEPVVIAETERLLDALFKRDIAVAGLVVNRFPAAPDGCSSCHASRSRQIRLLQSLCDRRANLPVAVLPIALKEIRGKAALLEFIGSASDPGQDISEFVPSPAAAQREPTMLPAPEPGREFFMFCGKGGVGKTTLACAFALQLSRTYPEQRVLLFSTDPAHSLSDCLAQGIGAEETKVAGTLNLFAREINPDILFEAWKQAYSRQIEEVFAEFSSRAGFDLQFDREVIAGLLDLTPPGLDELMCLSELATLAERRAYDFYVLDTAPGGHTLRFLELPAVVRDWLRALFEILLKYRQVVRLSKVSETLVEMSQRIRKIQQVFTNAARCEAIPVTIPTQAAREETGRLISALDLAGVRTQRLLINQVVTAPGPCRYCCLTARQHGSEIQRLRKTFRDLETVVFPLLDWELRGTDSLARLLRFAGVQEPSPVEVAG